MPELRLVQAAQAKIAHCKINNGYKIKNGGVGTVNIMVTEHPILRSQATISNTHLTGLLFQSSRIQLTTLRNILIVNLFAGKIFAFGFALNIKLVSKAQNPDIAGSVPHHITVSAELLFLKTCTK